MKNKLIDLHNSLFITLEDLDDEELYKDPKKIEALVSIAKAKVEISEAIINVDRLGLEAAKASVVNAIAIPAALQLKEAVQ